jgi:hypothetical protein
MAQASIVLAKLPTVVLLLLEQLASYFAECIYDTGTGVSSSQPIRMIVFPKLLTLLWIRKLQQYPNIVLAELTGLIGWITLNIAHTHSNNVGTAINI